MLKFTIRIPITICLLLLMLHSAVSLSAANDMEPDMPLYNNILVSLIKQCHGLTDNNFNEHIAIESKSLTKYHDGEIFNIYYTLQKEWIKVQLIGAEVQVLFSPASDTYKYLGLPRGEYLTRDEVWTLITQKGNYDPCNDYQDISKPLYWDSEETMRKAILNTVEAKFSYTPILPLKMKAYLWRGHIVYRTRVEINLKENECVDIMAFPFTGKIDADKNVCIIIM